MVAKRSNRIPYIVALIGGLVALSSIDQPTHAGGLFDFLTGGKADLKKIESSIQKRFPEIGHLTPTELADKFAVQTRGKQTSQGGPIVLDVREVDEFNVSHLPGAIRIDPKASPQAVMDTIKTQNLSGRVVVFYCSVGERSSRMAKKAKALLIASGAKKVHNLRGGIFAWHNEQRALTDASGATEFVHPFSETWGRLVDRSSLTRYKPHQHP